VINHPPKKRKWLGATRLAFVFVNRSHLLFENGYGPLLSRYDREAGDYLLAASLRCNNNRKINLLGRQNYHGPLRFNKFTQNNASVRSNNSLDGSLEEIYKNFINNFIIDNPFKKLTITLKTPNTIIH